MDSYFLNGSNFKSGFTAGQIQIPTETSPGVPVGLPIPYIVTKPIPRGVLYEGSFELTPTTKSFVPLTQFTKGTVESLNGNTKVLLFDYPRVINARLTALSVPDTNVNVFASYYDGYGQIGINQTILNNVSSDQNPIVPCLGFASIYLTSDAPVTATIQFELSNTFELPITDNGILSQLLEVSAFSENPSNKFDGLWATTFNDSEPYMFQWDGNYTVATTAEATIIENAPRPWFEPLNGGERFDDSISDYTFVFLQNVYGTGNATNFNNSNLPKIGKVTEEIKYVYGQPNYTKGFTPWQG